MLDRRQFLAAVGAAAPLGVLASRALASGRTLVDPAEPADISDLLAPIITKSGIPGMSGCVVDGGVVTHFGAAGVRKMGAEGDDAAFRAGDKVHIGSDGKAMTASLCGLLVERGVLRWDLTLAEALPDLKDRLHADYRAVTLRQLLTHTAGVPNDMLETGLLRRLHEEPGTMTEGRRIAVEDALTRKPAAAPGTKHLYSNTGYIIAGYIAETLGGGGKGKSYEDLMREHIFAPCGITTAGFGAPGTPGVLDQPRGHTAAGKPVEPGPRGAGDNPLQCAPAGTMHFSISDWARFVAQHLGAGKPDQGPRLLKPETLAELHRPQPGIEPPYACGWLVVDRPWAGGEALTHAGSNTMWFAVVWAAPKRNFAVLIACNRAHDAARGACDEAIGALIERRTADRKQP